MSIKHFLDDLEKTGRVTVPNGHEPNESECQAIHKQLIARDALQRSTMIQGVPEFNLEACEWAALQLYRACQFLVCRNVTAELVEEVLEKDYHEEKNASVIYSVDLYFVYLRHLLDLAAGISEDDQLVQTLRILAVRWPLSSVGIDCDGDIDIDVILADKSLKQLYIDRIIETADHKRAEDKRVKEAIETCLGAYPSLSGFALQG